ncbi:shikimate dehydrogenase [Pseudonocardia petroleophila]|uniref:Shikimate dehydrogenase n=1 Tax=Pseudonocardia petroleophila TaxID=37331 RepID=A0A7G7MFF0_9PSEU|nr:shikimate dehydrogenase [Pseudonocardia petroleophila]QNG51511.1 shikimate dehydrogenase [Pseudonocardia petroleophila]
MRRAAVLGSPVAHSLSPVLHTAAYAALGLDDWRYDHRECTEDGLASFLDGLGPEWAGLSLTMPLKRAALDLAHGASELAVATGAANTLVLRDGRRFADNTDVAGIVAALGPVSGRAVVLGAGGTAQAALAALRGLGIDDVTVLVRSAARAEDLRAAAKRLGVDPLVDDALADPARASAVLDRADVVVSTLPAGAADDLRGAAGVVLDVVYAPWPTAFAAAAQAAGARVVSGLEMLLHQAVAQVQLMTGHPGPVDAMRAALDDAVAARAS